LDALELQLEELDRWAARTTCLLSYDATFAEINFYTFVVYSCPRITSGGQEMGNSLLSSFPIIETTQPDEMEAALVRAFGIRAFDVREGSAGFYARTNKILLQSVRLTNTYYGPAVRIKYPEMPFVRQQICLSGAGRTTMRGTGISLSPQASCTISAGVETAADLSCDFEILLLRFDLHALTQKLVALLGVEPKRALQFDAAADFQQLEMQSFYRLVVFVANELNATAANLPKPVLAELDQALLVSFLFSNRHDLSDLLARPAAQIAPWQVRLVEDYIEANWDQSITVERLSTATGASVRSIFSTFKRSRGYSSMTFLKQVRLRHAKEMLMRANAGTTVTAVALACCFLNVGHFAREYRAAFGELPSETLGRARGSEMSLRGFAAAAHASRPRL
jgi:AraC-like DNA-binding protein